MRAFLDFEASSLSDESYPIEVAWVFQDGRSESHLIAPAPSWTEWDAASEAVHGIARSTLEREGKPHEMVAQRMVEALSDRDLFASAPSWDGKWLSALLRTAGLPRHALKLRDTDDALRETAAEILRPMLRAAALDREVHNLVARLSISPTRRQRIARCPMPWPSTRPGAGCATRPGACVRGWLAGRSDDAAGRGWMGRIRYPRRSRRWGD